MSPSLRKAAILISSLDPSAADRLLDQMGEQQAACVRNAVLELDEVDPAEQEAILAEFFGETPASDDSEGAVVLQLSSAEETPPQTVERSALPRFHFLHGTPSGDLARRLHQEHPQLIALLAAHLPAEKSAEVLEHLPATLRYEVLNRLQDLDDAEPTILADLERELERHFGGCQKGQSGGPHRKQLASILGHLQRQPEPVLPMQNRPDASASIRPSKPETPVPSISFDQLLSLSAADFFAVFDGADPRVVMLALAGAPRRIFERYLAQFSTDRALEFEHHLEQLRPLRLRDVESAQQQLATLAGCRLQAAKTAAESSRRFAAAA